MERLISWVVKRDNRILYLLNQELQSPFLDRWMSKITHLGGAIFTISLFGLLIILAFFQYGFGKKGLNGLGVEGLVALGSSHLLVQILKRCLGRPRPYIDQCVRVWVKPLKDHSFPSGHTTAIFSLTTTLSLASPWLASLLYPVACLVGFSRIYLGHHYPTDVAIGALLGISFAVGTHIYF